LHLYVNKAYKTMKWMYIQSMAKWTAFSHV
jgi:hypothetical protein